MLTASLITATIIAIIYGSYLHYSYKNQKTPQEKSIKYLKEQKGKYTFNLLDRNAFADLPVTFVFKQVTKYYTHSRSRTALKNWRKLNLITLDKTTNIYSKTDLGKTYRSTF